MSTACGRSCKCRTKAATAAGSPQDIRTRIESPTRTSTAPFSSSARGVAEPTPDGRVGAVWECRVYGFVLTSSKTWPEKLVRGDRTPRRSSRTHQTSPTVCASHRTCTINTLRHRNTSPSHRVKSNRSQPRAPTRNSTTRQPQATNGFDVRLPPAASAYPLGTSACAFSGASIPFPTRNCQLP